jgi:orotidine-5'-phosphate decarboxylase
MGFGRSSNERGCSAPAISRERCGSPIVYRNPLIVAADLSDPDEAERLAAGLADLVAFVKVGLELFTAAGPAVVERLRRHAPVFLDVKFHDIPTTVRRAARNAGRLGIDLLTVHSLGGPDMVAAAVEGAAEGADAAGVDAPAVVAVTVLSSLAGEGLRRRPRWRSRR